MLYCTGGSDESGWNKSVNISQDHNSDWPSLAANPSSISSSTSLHPSSLYSSEQSLNVDDLSNLLEKLGLAKYQELFQVKSHAIIE